MSLRDREKAARGLYSCSLVGSAPSAASASAEGTASTAAKGAATAKRTPAAPEGATASEAAGAVGSSAAEPAARTGTTEGSGGAMPRPSPHRPPAHGRVMVVVVMVVGARGEHPEGAICVVGAVVAAPIPTVPGALHQGEHHNYQQENHQNIHSTSQVRPSSGSDTTGSKRRRGRAGPGCSPPWQRAFPYTHGHRRHSHRR